MGNRICPVCRHTEAEVLKTINMKIPTEYHLPESYNVVCCEECGFVYADTSATMEDYDWYYSHCNFYGDDSKDDNSARYEMTEELLKRYLNKDSMLLDIGAGNGRFEVALKEHGYTNITATDPSEESVDRLCNAGICAYVSSIYADVLKDEYEKYDGIFLFEVAEHLLMPEKGIANIRQMLKMGGIFILSVPDYSQIAEDKSSIPNYFNLEHINYFSEVSLDNLMSRFGLQRIEQKRYGVDLVHVYKKIEETCALIKDVDTQYAVEKYLKAQEEREIHIKEIIHQLKESQEEIYIWGTGSYVMSLIATTELLQCKINGFIDNNKLKQGREMYEYRIYTPDYLRDKSCTVVICSMLYSEEIKLQIEAMHTQNEIVVL